MMATSILKGKEQVLRILEGLPEDSSFEEILKELAFHRMVERGIEDADAGRLVGHEEVKRRIESWRK